MGPNTTPNDHRGSLPEEGLETANATVALAISVSSSQAKNNDPRYEKPCEDSYVADGQNRIFVVADGISRDARKDGYPVPSPATRCSEIFARKFHISLSENLPGGNNSEIEALRVAVADANKAVGILNTQLGLGSDFLENDLAGTVFSAVLLRDNRLSYAMVGDCSIRVIYDDRCELISCAPPEPIGRSLPIDPAAVKQNTAFRREAFRNKGDAESPGHYGVINGEAGVLPFVRYGTFDLTNVRRVLISSDGVEPLLEQDPANCSLAPQAIVDKMIALESTPSSGIRSDDKTVVAIDFR